MHVELGDWAAASAPVSGGKRVCLVWATDPSERSQRSTGQGAVSLEIDSSGSMQ